MKLIMIFLTFFIGQNLYANKIDSLRSDQDVAQFIISISDNIKNDQTYAKLVVRPTEQVRKDLDCGGIAEKWQISNWEKTDLNKDGHTDIVVVSYWYNYDVFVAMDNGDNTFKLIRLSNNVFEKCEMAKPVMIDNTRLLLYNQRKSEHSRVKMFDIKQYDQIDTLIYKYDAFIERNKKPASYKIDSIIIENSSCLGSCPVFKIAIAANGNASYIANWYNSTNGTFAGQIKKADLDNIKQLINYLDIKKLRNSYSVTWTDDQTVKLRVKFKDGSEKSITDYGEIGTFGLNRLYTMLSALRTDQAWNKISGKRY